MGGIEFTFDRLLREFQFQRVYEQHPEAIKATMLLGGNFLDYDLLSQNAVSGQHLGILLVEGGVGITVSSVMLMIFYAFAGRDMPADADDVGEGESE